MPPFTQQIIGPVIAGFVYTGLQAVGGALMQSTPGRGIAPIPDPVQQATFPPQLANSFQAPAFVIQNPQAHNPLVMATSALLQNLKYFVF